MNTIFILLIIFQIKHFLCDYPLQTRYMLGKFNAGWSFIPPLALHCTVHAVVTFLIVAAFTGGDLRLSTLLAILDFVMHFIQDRIKAGPKYLGRWKPDNKYFWWALGQDQMVHHFTHYFIIFLVIRSIGS